MRYNELLLAGRRWEARPMAGHFVDAELVSYVREEMKGNPAQLLGEKVPFTRPSPNGQRVMKKFVEPQTAKHTLFTRKSFRRRAAARSS